MAFVFFPKWFPPLLPGLAHSPWVREGPRGQLCGLLGASGSPASAQGGGAALLCSDHPTLHPLGCPEKQRGISVSLLFQLTLNTELYPGCAACG